MGVAADTTATTSPANAAERPKLDGGLGGAPVRASCKSSPFRAIFDDVDIDMHMFDTQALFRRLVAI
jgi:hypothetical protein